MPDLYAISTALASRFAAGQVTPPAGFQNIRVATAAPPNSMAALPCVFVFAEDGAFQTGNGTRMGQGTWLVRFYFDQTGDISRHAVGLQKWVTVLADQLKGSVQLGGIVARATVDSWRIGVLPYGAKEYSGAELSVTIVTAESWAAVA